MDEITKKEYELSFLVKEEKDVQAIKKLMRDFDFEINYDGELKKMALPYKIKGETSAVFGFFYFLADPEKIEKFTKDIKIEKECLRSMIISNPVKKQEGVEKEEPKEEKKSPKKVEPEKEDKALTNEELEKKLEEILN